MAFTGLNYNAPTQTNGGTASAIDAGGSTGAGQMETYFYLKKALVYARKLCFFTPLASVINMPKNFGQTLKVYVYIPLLDDRNVNSQGLNAAGVTFTGGTAGANGNLYGSSRDIGTINSVLPSLTEAGGRVNRVGFTRQVRQGSLFKFGFFTEFTQESMDFDSDSELMDHLSTELMNGAIQMTEAVLQRDLLAAAGVLLFGGAATSISAVTGEGATPTLVSYKNMIRLDQILTNNRTPKQTTIINGSRLIDTMTIPSSRIMFIGNELLPVVKGMTDLFGGKAFIPVQHYADAGTVLNGEIGSIDSFRIIQVPEMLHWAGAGAAATSANPGYRTSIMSGGVATLNGESDTAGGSGSNYDVYPMLVIGDDSFATIGFQTDGKTVKFSVMTKMPGRETAFANSDPFGETGFSSIKWFYGFLVKYPERIGLIYTVAPV